MAITDLARAPHPILRPGCYTCGRASRTLPLRVVFVSVSHSPRRGVLVPGGFAFAVCDGCLERVQRNHAAWAYCYRPRSVTA